MKYEYCLKSDVDSFCRSKTLPRNLGLCIDDVKGPRVYPKKSVYFYNRERGSPYKKRPHKTFVVTADVEPPR